MVEPPAVAVIFTSTRTLEDEQGYVAMSKRMENMAAEHDGFISVCSVRDTDSLRGITVSYWRDDEAARSWKRVQEHLLAQNLGRTVWYADYTVVVASVTRAYTNVGFGHEEAS